MPVETVKIPKDYDGKRIDLFLVSLFALRFSRTKIQKLISAGKVNVNGEIVKPNYTVHENQEVSVEFEDEIAAETRAENIPLDIIFEDKDLLIVNKPPALVAHPACGNLNGTLVNALLYHIKHLSTIGGETRPGIVHRLDKDTSGLMVVAKNDAAHSALAIQFNKSRVEKIYWAVVKGVVEHDEMVCDASLKKSSVNRRKVVVDENGRQSKTYFKVLKRFKAATLLEVKPETGRTHQIRVHLRHLGYPVLGDKEYGVPSPYIDRQALHAKSIAFIHPTQKKKVSFTSEIPADIKELLDHLAS